jgi:hypothetical protein
MSVAKNKLQDIYDAGSNKLDELARSQGENFRDTAQTHGGKISDTEKSTREQLQQRATEVKSEINSSLERSVQRIAKAIETEKAEIERHLKELTESITSLAGNLTESVHELRESHEANLAVLSEDATDLYEREFKSASGDLKKLDFASSKNLRVQNTFVINTFQQKLDHGLLEARGEEKQVSNRLMKLFLQNTNAIDSKVSTLGRDLSSDLDGRTGALEERFQGGMAELEQQAEQLLEQADKHVGQTAQAVHESYERDSFACKSEFEKSGSQCLSEIAALHENTLKDLSGTFDGFFKDLGDSAESARQLLRIKTDTLRSKVTASVESLAGECNKRKDASIVLNREIENSCKEILEKIRRDLAATHKDFEERLGKAAKAAVDELEVICTKAETNIRSIRQSSESELASMADKARAQIQVTLVAFLDRVAARREAALEEVHRAAAAAPGVPEPKQPETTKKKKTTTRERPAVPDKDTSGGSKHTGETRVRTEGAEDVDK